MISIVRCGVGPKLLKTSSFAQWTDGWEVPSITVIQKILEFVSTYIVGFRECIAVQVPESPRSWKDHLKEHILWGSYSLTNGVVQSRPFEALFRPGRNVDMSIIFSNQKSKVVNYPRCHIVPANVGDMYTNLMRCPTTL
jgi:hypothetical protein